jgi:hypothetical protein
MISLGRDDTASITKVLEKTGERGFYESLLYQLSYVGFWFVFNVLQRIGEFRCHLLVTYSCRLSARQATRMLSSMGFSSALPEIVELFTCGFNLRIKTQLAAIVQGLQSSP